jgi:pimeloyl-ACP methyl ester carboxylesterase
MRVRKLRSGLALATAAVTLAACGATEPTGSPPAASGGAFQPTYAEVACPQDVEIQLLVEHACGRLTVLEDRGRPDGRTISIFILRMEPPGGDSSPDPMLAISGDIGDAASFGGMAPGPERLHRTWYVMEPRGVGHSEPSLACPEVNELAIEAVQAASSDPTFREAFLTAVQACRDRLAAGEVDVAAYDAATAAADVVDLRRALGIAEWNLIGFGSNSRILIEAARQDADAVRSLVLDSPQLPRLPDALVARPGMDQAIEALGKACAADAACAAVAPDLPDLFDIALAKLDAEPITVTDEGGPIAQRAGEPISITVDGGAFLRVVRSVLGGDGPANVRALPATIASAADGELSDQVIRILGSDPTLCAGYRPICYPSGSFSLGTFLSMLCRDDEPFLDREALGTDAGPSVQAVFGDNPYLAACEAWRVPPADEMTETLEGSYPLLVLAGELDSFTPYAPIAESLSGRPAAYLLSVPTQTHNVIGFADCVVAIRNAWVDRPDAPPADTSCLATLTTSFSEAN